MTKTKWTPGPHFAEITRSQIPESEDADITYIITDKDKNEIVTFYNESAETFANAQLYAAASDLYAATDWVDSVSASSQFEYVYVRLSVDELNALIDARRRAREGK